VVGYQRFGWGFCRSHVCVAYILCLRDCWHSQCTSRCFIKHVV